MRKIEEANENYRKIIQKLQEHCNHLINMIEKMRYKKMNNFSVNDLRNHNNVRSI